MVLLIFKESHRDLLGNDLSSENWQINIDMIIHEYFICFDIQILATWYNLGWVDKASSAPRSTPPSPVSPSTHRSPPAPQGVGDGMAILVGKWYDFKRGETWSSCIILAASSTLPSFSWILASLCIKVLTIKAPTITCGSVWPVHSPHRSFQRSQFAVCQSASSWLPASRWVSFIFFCSDA